MARDYAKNRQRSARKEDRNMGLSKKDGLERWTDSAPPSLAAAENAKNK